MSIKVYKSYINNLILNKKELSILESIIDVLDNRKHGSIDMSKTPITVLIKR